MKIHDTLVVTPTLGNRDTLEQTVASVAEIGGGRVRHILTCPEYAVVTLSKKFPELQVVADSGKKGIYPAVNSVISRYISGYSYVTYINDDDYWLPGFKLLFQKLDASPALDVAYGRVLFEYPGGRTSPVAHTTNYRALPNLVSHSIIPFTQQGVLMRSSVYLDNKGFDESYHLVADTDFWIRSIKFGHRYHGFNEFCAGYRIHPGQLSAASDVQSDEHRRMAIQHSLKRSAKSYIDKLNFRFRNAPLYLSRWKSKKFSKD